MDAIIVAGGLGTRLRPLTQHRPKHLLPVAGVPFVTHQIAKLGAAGVRRVVLATSYQAELFEPVLGNGSRWGVELRYVTETLRLGTAGAIRNAASQLGGGGDDVVVVMNGDILSGHDLRSQVARHRELAADVTLHLVEVDDARAFGCVPTGQGGRVTAFVEKSPDPPSRQVNAGCYVFTRRVIEEIPERRVVSVERETFPALLAAGYGVHGHLDASYWLDLGTPAALCRGSADVVRGLAGSPAFPEPPAESWVDPTARVAVTASLRGGTAVGARAEIGAEVWLDGCIVDEGAVVERGARLVSCAVGPDARVGANGVLSGVALGDRADIGAGCELIDGARVWGDVTIPAGGIRYSSDV